MTIQILPASGDNPRRVIIPVESLQEEQLLEQVVEFVNQTSPLKLIEVLDANTEKK